MDRIDVLNIIRNSLLAFDAKSDLHWYSSKAERLVFGTAATETDLGASLVQTNGNALGLYQCEPSTYNWLVDKYLNTRDDIKQSILDATGYKEMPPFHFLIHDFMLSTLICRLRYWVVPEKLPTHVDQMAGYWKKYYNTEAGKGNEQDFISKYALYSLGIF